MQKVFFKIFGCKVNQLEVEAIRDSYITRNFNVTDKLEDADAVVIGSCTVTHTAESKLVKFARKALRANDESRVIVVGCWLPVIKSRLTEFADRIEFVDNETKFSDIGTHIPDTIRISSRTRSFIKIQEGCNSFCSYCIIPYMRSKLHSRSISDTVHEVKKNINAGAREIVLVGIHLGLWRENESRLHNLLENLIQIDGEWRLRLTSLEVHEITPELISLLSTSNRLVEHLHISLQSGSSDVLRRMNRNYSKEFFLEKIAQIREKLPLAGISTDIIVGFPGETDADFADTLDVIEKAQFMRVHAFPFSARAGTKAYDFTDKIHPGIIKHREKQIMQTALECRIKFSSAFIDKTVEILTEESKPDGVIGYTREYLPARIISHKNQKLNEFFYGKVKSIENDGTLILNDY
ncbi:MAG: MiaB/RimO family radical SAM methylthiotransferase [Planctomycetes bacterium]|nr:MiaB/RimO family radical SAM methylthiotransferase [Planctomycetota bacterium]